MALQEPPPRLSFKGQELALELVDAGSVTLVRAYSHPAADWHPPPVPLRNNHIDPPPGYGDDPEFQAFLAAHPFIRPTGTRRTLSHGDPLDRIPV